MSAVVIKVLENAAIERIGEIDRSEHVTLGYTYRDGNLVSEAVDWVVPRWPMTGSNWSVEARIQSWLPKLEQGGTLLGAVEGETLAGFAIVLPGLTETMAQLVALFVSRDFRRQGIAKQLTASAINIAKEAGAKTLYVSATPSESAVGFYQSQGFELAREVHPKLFELEPEDIHMMKNL